MRELYVLEVKNANGVFQPRVGLSTRTEIAQWMEKFIPVDVRARVSDWRIVIYVPIDIEIQDISVVH